MTRTLTPDKANALTLRLDIKDAAVLNVIVESRADMEVTLSPARSDDTEALWRIDQATSARVQDRYSDEFRVSVPTPRSAQGTSGINVIGSGNVIINGHRITSHGGSGTDGQILVEARIPERSSVIAETRTASLVVRGSEASMVAYETTSGDLLVEEAFHVVAKSVSGDVEVDSAEVVSGTTVSGDIAVKRATVRADLQTVSGDVFLSPAVGTLGKVSSVSGDVTLRTSFETETVSGRVREM